MMFIASSLDEVRRAVTSATRGDLILVASIKMYNQAVGQLKEIKPDEMVYVRVAGVSYFPALNYGVDGGDVELLYDDVGE